MQAYCSLLLRWLVSGITSCADKRGGGWEREKIQRTGKRHDDGHGKDVGPRLLLLVALVMAARAPPPQANRHRNKKRGTGAKILAALRRLRIPSSIVCFQPIDIDNYSSV